MSLGIFVVGPSDKKAIPILLRKLGQTQVHSRLAEQDEMLDVEAMRKHIEALIHIQTGISRVLIFMDSECEDPGNKEEQARRRERELARYLPKLKVKYVIVDHSLEGWLASDEEALRAVLGPRASIHLPPNPEAHCRPADLLTELFRTNGRDFLKTRDCHKIAEHIDTKKLLAQSQTFPRLEEALKDC